MHSFTTGVIVSNTCHTNINSRVVGIYEDRSKNSWSRLVEKKKKERPSPHLHKVPNQSDESTNSSNSPRIVAPPS